MDKYLPPEDDGLPARESGEWVREKLFYVKRYIDVIEVAVRDQDGRKRLFIDLFSGPGKWIVKDTNEYLLGSPLLALETQHPFADDYCVDMDSKNIANLKTRAKASKVSEDHIHCLVGDANQQVSAITSEMARIGIKFIQGSLPCLDLAFVESV